MHQNRPKNLNLFTIRFPIAAIVSIFHRISGAILFIMVPFCLWVFQQSLTPQGFGHLQWLAKGMIFKIVAFFLLSALIFHVVAGIRHLLSDVHVGTGLAGGQLSARLTWVISTVFIILVGIWLW